MSTPVVCSCGAWRWPLAATGGFAAAPPVPRVGGAAEAPLVAAPPLAANEALAKRTQLVETVLELLRAKEEMEAATGPPRP